MSIDPTKPIVATCGDETYPAEITEVHDAIDGIHDGRATVVAHVGAPHRLRIGDEISEPNSWNFFIDDGSWNGAADLRIANS